MNFKSCDGLAMNEELEKMSEAGYLSVDRFSPQRLVTSMKHCLPRHD